MTGFLRNVFMLIHTRQKERSDFENGAFLCLWEQSKTGSEYSPKQEVLQDSGLEINVAYEVNFQTEYLPIDFSFPIRCSLHFSFIRLSPLLSLCG